MGEVARPPAGGTDLGEAVLSDRAVTGTGPPPGCSTGTVEDRPPQEAELVARAKRGEPDAYEEIVRRHQTIAFRTAWVITRLGRRCRGGGAGRLREGACARSAASARARRCGPGCSRSSPTRRATGVRSAGRRAGLALRVAEERRPDGAVPSPEAALLDSERRDELLAALGGLSESDRQAIACRYLLELSEEETAAALDCARGTVKSRCRARSAGCARSWPEEAAMAELERQLTQLGPRARLAAHARPRAARRSRIGSSAAAGSRRRRPQLPAASSCPPVCAARSPALLLLCSAVRSSPPCPRVRDAVLEFFGLQGATVERRERLPPVAEPAAARARRRARRSTPRATRSPSSRSCPRTPADPDAVFVRDASPAAQLSLAYRPRPRPPRGAQHAARPARRASSAATCAPSTSARSPARPPGSSA